MTGEELGAWRERLGKDEAWGAGVCAGLVFACYHEWPRESAAGSERRQAAEGEARWGYDQSEVSALRTAYHAALEAEERAQAARGPVEPVCPEGVTVERACGRGPMLVFGHRDYSGGNPSRIVVEDDGTIRYGAEASKQRGLSAAQCRHAADLSEYRAAIHAANDKQRKLDAVRAAEAAVVESHKATEAAHAAYRAAEDQHARAVSVMLDAKREAGL